MTNVTRLSKSILFLTMLTLSSISFGDTKLSAGVVEQWILSQQALERWGQKNQEVLAKYEQQNEQPENPFTIDAETMIAPLKKSGLHAQAQNLIRQYGFSSMTSWAEATLAITKAAAAIEFENSPAMFDAEKLRSMMKDARLSDQQKAMMQKAIDHNKAMVDSLKAVSEEEKDVIRPFLQKISTLLNKGR